MALMALMGDTSAYGELLASGAALIDLRAPAEYAKGAFPTARNLPLLNDDERHQVGTCYKQRGQQAALELGHRLVSGDLRAGRVTAWRNIVEQHRGAALYCWRIQSQVSFIPSRSAIDGSQPNSS